MFTHSFAMYSLVDVGVAAEACHCFQPRLPGILRNYWEVACPCCSSHALQNCITHTIKIHKLTNVNQ